MKVLVIRTVLLTIVLINIYVNIYSQPDKKDTPDSVIIEVKNLGNTINSSFSDYGPVISADGSVLFFTSKRPVTEKEKKKNKPSMEHIYLSENDEKEKKWNAAQLLKGSINMPGKNNSIITVSNDGQRMLLYRDDVTGNGDIYESVLQGEVWSVPQKLPEPVNSKYHESSASISPDGRTIYFVSTRPGGEGGRDIWYCTQNQDGQWGIEKNLGNTVNTGKNEESVYIHPDGVTLYFSSQGHDGLGGHDIYKTTKINEKWSKPKNLGKQINTAKDDVFFVMEANGRRAYLSSEREGSLGEKDIFLVLFTPLKLKREPKLTLLKGIIVDEETLESLEASIEIVDNEKNEKITKITSNSTSGKYLVSLPAGKNYGIHVSAIEYLFHSENFNIPDTANYQEISQIIKLKKIKVGKKVILKNIFFDYDKTTLRPESFGELNHLIKIIQQNPTIKIEISGHTDNIGTAAYNQKLSEERAKAVVNYLISTGIESSRLTYTSYGFSQPISTNETKEGRQLNRRTEFKIIDK